MTEALSARLVCSPYYVEKLLALGLAPQDLGGLESIMHFPITTREELLRHSDRIISFLGPNEHASTHKISSTGTSGLRLQVYRGLADERRTIALWEAAAGAKFPNELRVLFVCTLGQPKEYEVSKSVESKNIRISRVAAGSLSGVDMNDYDILTGTPDGLLAALATRSFRARRRPPLLGYTTALPLAEDQANRIAARLGCAHLHCYSMTEAGPIAWRCKHCQNTYHVYADMFVESVVGRVCVTKLSDSVFPLLRYLTDDYAEVHSEKMPCGFAGTSLRNLIGRKNMNFYLGSNAEA